MRDIDAIIQAVLQNFPDADISQVYTKFPGADDDGLWIFKLNGGRNSVQIESSDGQLPFLLEHDGMSSSAGAYMVSTVERAVQDIVAYLCRLGVAKTT